MECSPGVFSLKVNLLFINTRISKLWSLLFKIFTPFFRVTDQGEFLPNVKSRKSCLSLTQHQLRC